MKAIRKSVRRKDRMARGRARDPTTVESLGTRHATRPLETLVATF